MQLVYAHVRTHVIESRIRTFVYNRARARASLYVRVINKGEPLVIDDVIQKQRGWVDLL